ncbi:Phasin protein [Polaromonas sp. OV174]|uniref:phasin family protein n=1 Tax=Polaromonas sp. OV174 TaxID=1855300 RepID=UPI0008E7C71C|nr:phasin family protein [Polaromonas sp. OV174]SFC25669.1 Phasin protein [Polaromonas sp. OV174]
MNTQTSRTVPSIEASSAGLSSWSLLADLGRQQFILATESACAVFRGSETIRKIQQQAAHHAALQHDAAAQKLRNQSGPSDLLVIQADLMLSNLQGATQYWQQLAAAMIKTQVDMAACTSQVLQTAPEYGLKPALEA